jgi:hypothetical protein
MTEPPSQPAGRGKEIPKSECWEDAPRRHHLGLERESHPDTGYQQPAQSPSGNRSEAGVGREDQEQREQCLGNLRMR